MENRNHDHKPYVFRLDGDGEHYKCRICRKQIKQAWIEFIGELKNTKLPKNSSGDKIIAIPVTRMNDENKICPNCDSKEIYAQNREYALFQTTLFYICERCGSEWAPEKEFHDVTLNKKDEKKHMDEFHRYPNQWCPIHEQMKAMLISLQWFDN